MDFYGKVLEICKNNDISVTALTQELGISKANIRNWKNGVVPKFSIRLKIAKIAHIPVEEVLTPDEIKTYETIQEG